MFRKWREYFRIKHSGLFDPHYYLKQYSDVRKSDVDPLMHFVEWGWREGRNPSIRFNTEDYLEKHPSVRAAGINPVIHFLKHGNKEEMVVENPQKIHGERIGIVIVTYNASLALRITLASLREAKNVTPFSVIVVDNASALTERIVIRNALERHVREANLNWRYVQLEKNIGFSGGNNIGIELFLKDPTISHICLLNSDVLVSDYWLDRLVQNKYDVLNPVTNKASSIQSIPIDYDVRLSDCLDQKKEAIVPQLFDKINSFAQEWHKAWQGNNFATDHDITFFCSVISKELIKKIGLLDENFFPGGYEDFDYCARVRAVGGTIGLVRDVFVHHWGSSSFGLLSRSYFNNNAVRNLNYLEQKHKITLTDPLNAPFISFTQDVVFALQGNGDQTLQLRFLSNYVKALTNLLKHFCDEFIALQKHLESCEREIPSQLVDNLDQVNIYSNLLEKWDRVVKEIYQTRVYDRYDSSTIDSIQAKLETISNGAYMIATCNMKMAGFLFNPNQNNQTSGGSGKQSGFGRFVAKVRRGINFYRRLKGIVFFGGYPYPEREMDGYYQRIRFVDSLFPNEWRIYIDRSNLENHGTWYDRPAPNTIVLFVNYPTRQKWWARFAMGLIILRIRKIYFHSILPMKDVEFLMSLPGILKIVDIHGIVPEEFRFHDDPVNAEIFSKVEKTAVEHANRIIVVTEAMRLHLEGKYGNNIHGQFILLPIFQEVPFNPVKKPYNNTVPVIVYAGGLQKWQQVPKMLDTIMNTANTFRYKFYCPDPEEIRSKLTETFIQAHSIEVDSKPISELLNIYRDCHFGFILREDIAVNHVACPTKLIEYLGMGIVPIMDCENIGDFKRMGIRFVRQSDIIQGKFPNEVERDKMAQDNYNLYKKLQDIQLSGSLTLQHYLGSSPNSLNSHINTFVSQSLRKSKQAFPFGTKRGRVARWIFHKFPIKASSLQQGKHNQATPLVTVGGTKKYSELLACDILVQVDNFLAGGLENAVLDINESLKQTGFRVSLLVLGETGLAVDRARKAGYPVIVTQFEPDEYEHLLRVVSPKLVFSHYSIHGAAICAKLNIPLIQMIHNVYMWFSQEQLAAFQEAARYTCGFIIPTEFAKNYSVTRLGIPLEKCYLIPYGIDVDKLIGMDFFNERIRLRSKYQFSDDDFIFLSVAAINHQKNLLGLVRAFHSMVDEIPQVKLVLLGPAYEVKLFEEIKHYIQHHRLDPWIIYAGESSEPYSFYAMADAFVCSSFFEGGPLVFLEALASNLPIVSTKVGFGAQFENLRGVSIVSPPVDILTYHGTISQLNSTPDFEQALTTQMKATYRDRTKPEIQKNLIKMMDKRLAYKLFANFIKHFLETGEFSSDMLMNSWPNLIGQNISISKEKL